MTNALSPTTQSTTHATMSPSVRMPTTCQQCSGLYTISSQDEEFYESISPQFGGQTYLIPQPTLCPECRNQRRMAWRNDRSFFKRTCSHSGETMISLYPQNTPFPVFKSAVWWSDSWNPMDFAQDIDWNKPFFSQWKELMHKVPRRSLDLVNCQNSEYCNYCGDDKDCYLDIAGEGNEDCYYNLFTKYSKDCIDCTFVYKSQLCYESIQCYDCYSCKYSLYLENCSDCNLCYDLKGCTNCTMCINMRNKEYCIQNEQFTKEEYQQKIAKLQLEKYSSREAARKLWNDIRIEKGIYRDMYTLNCENCTGNDMKNSKNCHQAFNAGDCEDCKYIYDVLEAKTCQDMNYSLYYPEGNYELISTLQLKNCAWCMATHYSNNMYYCDLCENSSNCFGCIGLNHKEYCIFNTQYTRGEYEELVPKLIAHMQTTKEWGEFFSESIAPHGYNETVAHEYMPLTKQDALSKGFVWNDQEKEIPKVEKVLPAKQLPDSICDIPDDILDWAISCAVSNQPFKLIQKELDFYRTQGIPVPRLCPLQRHKNRNALRNPRKLCKRTCSESGKEIWTSYSADRPERVVCEQVYLEQIK